MADRTYLVKITAQAEGQLQEIIKYIASELKAPKAALRLLDDIERSILSLSQLPHRVALIEEEPWHNYGIRKMPEKNFLIYFWIDEENRRVQVTAVIYAKRDQLSQLSQMDME
ncbi:MAG: type II toxin-antitoxin system RelE/ParE family toxin [Bacillota bacterium]|jgi:toxin ParE1/3/4